MRKALSLAASFLLAATLTLVAMAGAAAADTEVTGFEDFTLGSPHSQFGWSATGSAGSGCAVYDHAIVNNTYGIASFGAKSLRMSNAVTSGCFGDQTFSSSVTNEAGETSAEGGGLSGGTRQPYFEAEWDFASTEPGSEQPGLSVVASPDRGDGARMSWIQMADTSGGLEVNFYDYQTGSGFVSSNVASELPRTSPHHIKITMGFVNGVANDIVKVYVDGVLEHTGTSWEDYFRDQEGNPTRTVDSVLFRTAGTAAPSTAGKGLLIDNLRTTTSPVPTSSTIVVDPPNMNGWAFFNEGATGSGVLVSGPAGALNDGSAQLVVDATGRHNIGTLAFAGTRLDEISELSYASSRASADPGNLLAISLQFEFDDDLTDLNDSFRGRLVLEPYLTVGSGNVAEDTWYTWNALDGKWWSSNAIFDDTCSQASPCTIQKVLATWPNAGIRKGSPSAGLLNFRAGGPWGPGFDGNVDDFRIAISGMETIYDFEPEEQCTTTCYVDATVGDDSFGGASPARAKATIQAALNQVSGDGQVRVLPGTYDEVAPGSTPTSLPGTYQFGLFFHSSKPGITLMGVTDGDVQITDPNATEATINTDATNNFGFSGIFVEAANTSIQGVEIGPNVSGDNKTIEVVADNFTLQYANTDIPNGGGSVYINDFSPDGTVVQSYHVLDNVFDDGTSVDLASGAGNTGLATGREIKNNIFNLQDNGFNAISFNGSGGVPWFVNPVGGAIITGNTFSNSTQYIRARGTYDNTQFDWESYWNENTFPEGAVINLVSEIPFDVQTYSFGAFVNARRIGGTIQGELDHSVDGNTVLVAAGTYAESPEIVTSVTLKSDEGSGLTTIDLQTGPTYLGSLTIGGAGSDVTVEGFTIEGRDGSCPATLATSNIYLEGGPDEVSIVDNVIEVGEAASCSNGDDGFGLITTYNQSVVNVNSLTVDDNTFQPLGVAGTRAFYVNPGVDDFLFSGNDVLGEFARPSITQAMDGLVEGNTIDGQEDGGMGLGTWGYPDANVFGHTTFSDNVFQTLGTALSLFETNDVVIEDNELTDNDTSVAVDDGFGATNFDPTTIDIHHNNITGNETAGVSNVATTAGTVDATCNWWDAFTGPTNAFNPGGAGDTVSGDVDFRPWLLAPAPGGACIGGAWTFDGFFSPVDNDDPNTVKAGRSVPLKWRIVDEDGIPIDDPSSFVSLTSFACSDPSVGIDESNATNTGLVSAGDGYWQFNWVTDPDYKGTCRTLVLTLGDGSVHTAEFEFK